jgi:1-deoxy-D-xylulose-5-phosphate reductoisomerase
MRKRIAVLGSTGSIGCQTLDVIERFPDRFEIVGLAAGVNIEKLAGQVEKHKPRIVSIGRWEDIPRFRSMVGSGVKIVAGIEGMTEVAAHGLVEVVVTSITGTLGLVPTVEAIKAGKDIALANKETLVAAGELVMSLVREKGVHLLPVDSEHSAIFQCLAGAEQPDIRRIILTASGGPFRNKAKKELRKVQVEDALKHPNWSMGQKITIDSATLMNKGLEVIEARWLFNTNFDKIDVVVHPQSIIHSMVEFPDGSVIAQLGTPDMRMPIQYALTYPERWANDFPKLDFLSLGELTFHPPRMDEFPCLGLAFQAGRQGGTMPAVMNAANEQAVAMFLNRRIGFMDISELIEKVMANHTWINNPGLDEILMSDSWARQEASRLA